MAKVKLSVNTELTVDVELEEVNDILDSLGVDRPDEMTKDELQEIIRAAVDDDVSWALDQINISEMDVQVEVLDVAGMDKYEKVRPGVDDEEEEDC